MICALVFLVAVDAATLGDTRPIAVARPHLASPRADALVAASSDSVTTVRGGGLPTIDFALVAYFAFWYLGNYFYNIANKMALKAAGGSAGYPMTIGVLQLGVGVLYALYMWLAPDARSPPKVTKDDLVKMLPVGFCACGAHCFSVFALSAGAVSFGQIVKAAEPAFAAVVSTLLYGKEISTAKWLALIPVIGGVVLASVKELDFAWAALIAACVANLFAAFKANENKKLMDADGIKDRIGSVGNQFALTTIVSFLFGLPLLILKEGHKWSGFVELMKTNKVVSTNLITSGLYFYLYNELATLTIKKTNAVTQSVANTAKRVIVIIGVALVLGESLAPIKLLGCTIGIGGVMLYSLIDKIVYGK
jgi:solute carrier family 35 protein E1